MSKRSAQCVLRAMDELEEAGQYLEGDQVAKNTRTIKLLRFVAAGLARRLDPNTEVPQVYPWEGRSISTGNNGVSNG